MRLYQTIAMAALPLFVVAFQNCQLDVKPSPCIVPVSMATSIAPQPASVSANGSSSFVATTSQDCPIPDPGTRIDYEAFHAFPVGYIRSLRYERSGGGVAPVEGQQWGLQATVWIDSYQETVTVTSTCSRTYGAAEYTQLMRNLETATLSLDLNPQVPPPQPLPPVATTSGSASTSALTPAKIPAPSPTPIRLPPPTPPADLGPRSLRIDFANGGSLRANFDDGDQMGNVIFNGSDLATQIEKLATQGCWANQ